MRKTGKEMAEELSSFLNSATYWEVDEFADTIASDHRALQQEAFKAMLKCVDRWADMDKSGYYDPRNEFTVKTSKKISDMLD